MRRRVYKPGGVQQHHGTQEDRPEHHSPTADDQQKYAQGGQREPVVLADPEMKLIFAKVGNISQKIAVVVMKGLPGENPTHVRPKAAIARGMRIARLVGELMMDAMRGHPEDRAAFQR